LGADDHDEPVPREEVKRSPLLRTFKYIKPNAFILSIAVLASMANGVVWPVFGVVFSEVMTLLLKVGMGTQEVQDKTQKDIY